MRNIWISFSWADLQIKIKEQRSWDKTCFRINTNINVWWIIESFMNLHGNSVINLSIMCSVNFTQNPAILWIQYHLWRNGLNRLEENYLLCWIYSDYRPVKKGVSSWYKLSRPSQKSSSIPYHNTKTHPLYYSDFTRLCCNRR